MKKKTPSGTERYRKMIRRRRIFVVTVAVFLLMLCICLFTPLFGISEITVVGNEHLSTEDVINTSGIKKGKNVFRTNTGKAEKAVEGMAYVKDCNIKRKFPARVIIEIDEAKPDLIFDMPNEFVVTTMDGRVLEKSEDVTHLTSPIVFGVNVTKSDPAQGMEAEDQDALEIHLERMRCFYGSSCWNEIDEFHVEDVSNFILMTKAGMKVTFGSIDSNEGLMRKVKMLEQILPQITQTNRSYLDLTIDKAYFGEYTDEELKERKEREESGETILSEREKKKKQEEDEGSKKEDSSSGDTNKEKKTSAKPSADVDDD